MAILAAGAFLRFCAIGRKSLWLDEAATMHAVDDRFVEVLKAVKAHDAHPPLYYALLHVWMQGSQGAMWARAFSAAFSAATLVVFYGLAWVLLPRGAAVVATLVFSVSAFHVYFAQEARHYALAAFFVVLSWYFLAELVAGRRLARWPFWLGLALSNAAALYTFYYCLFSVAAQVVVLLVLWRSIGRKLMLAWISWQLLPGALFAFYVPVILERMATLRRFAPPVGHTVLSGRGLWETVAQFTCGFLGALARLTGGQGRIVLGGIVGLGLLGVACALAALRSRRYVALVVLGWFLCCFLRHLAWPMDGRAMAVLVVVSALVLLVLALLLAALRGPRCGAAVALAWLLGPVVFLALLPIRGHTYEPKHLIFASPALALALGVALAACRGRLGRVFVAGLVVLVVAANASSLVLYYHPQVEKENWRGAMAELVQRVQPGDYVVFNPPWVQLPFHYYYRDHYRDRPVFGIYAPLAGKPFRAGELTRRRRVWVLEGKSNVEKHNPAVLLALQPYPRRFQKRYDGLVGRVRVFLYDTFEPLAKGAAPSR